MKYTIAIDLGGTIIKLGLMKNGLMIDRTEIPAQSVSGLKSHLQKLEIVINTLLEVNKVQIEDVLGIGFSFPGLVDSIKTRIISTNQKYYDGPDTDLVGWALSKWNLPLFAENDAQMALLGEWRFGAGKDCRDLVMVTIGTGIGTVVIIDGQLLKGKHFQAGNLGGHFTVNHRGTKCTCGNIGCVESEASTWRLPSMLKENPEFNSSSMNAEDVLDFKTLFDPELIILSGGIMKSASVIIPVLQEKINQMAWTPWGKVKVVEAKFPDSAALLGADYLCRASLNN